MLSHFHCVLDILDVMLPDSRSRSFSRENVGVLALAGVDPAASSNQPRRAAVSAIAQFSRASDLSVSALALWPGRVGSDCYLVPSPRLFCGGPDLWLGAPRPPVQL